MDVCITRHWQTSGRLVHELNVCTVADQSHGFWFVPRVCKIAEQKSHTPIHKKKYGCEKMNRTRRWYNLALKAKIPFKNKNNNDNQSRKKEKIRGMFEFGFFLAVYGNIHVHVSL